MSEPLNLPTPPTQPIDFMVVGIGASAGGIQALQSLLTPLSPNSGMAFVVVMHLSPDHLSSLAQVLQLVTAVPVTQVTGRTPIEPDHIYVIPPNHHLVLEGKELSLTHVQQAPGKRVAVDLFFRTLSAAFGPRAVCVVLSGIDSDGEIGVRHIKEQGGLTIAQDPAEAAFDGMPRSAIRTGMVDWVLPTGQIAERLTELWKNEQQMHLPPEEINLRGQEEEDRQNSGGPPAVQRVPSADDETALREVMRFLQGQTGHDFSYYKRATVLRRIARRLQVNLIEDIPSYLQFLRIHTAEATALLHDLLISVTNFFRDREAFAALQTHLPQLFAGKTESDQVRVWIAGCATGEEAYSLAILLHEHASRLPSPPSLQVFGTDLDEDVIQAARAGVYPSTIEADVSPERLQRFFQRDQGRYRIKKEIRETVLFSVHDVLRDSPFSRLDLISCRNLLIYLKREAQERVFEIFHYALRPGAVLFLGSSESLVDSHSLFAPLDKHHRIFVRRSSSRAGWQSFPLPSASIFSASETVIPRASSRFLPSLPPGSEINLRSLIEPTSRLLGEIHFNLLERYAPPSVLIDENYEMLHLSQNVGQFIQFNGGLPSMNLMKVIHPDLRIELRTALFRAKQKGEEITVSRVPLQQGNTTQWVNLHIRPMKEPEAETSLTLVIFEPLPDKGEGLAETVPREPAAQHLEAEIQYLKQQLSQTVEQYESSNEELKASNEELQAINEEMRSATEELETSKEELQSINEELNTVNQELKHSVEDLSRANSDLQNLMASTEIGTIFLDRGLQVKRFTPRIQELFNLISTDIGRPLSDITHRLNYFELTENAEQVLKNLHLIEREVSSDGKWFLVRMFPYRTLEDRIDGVVVNFIEVTLRKQVEEDRLRLEREVAVLEERTRIAQDLHDTLAQSLTGIKLQMDAAEVTLRDDPDAAELHIVRARDITQQSLVEARHSVRALRSPLLQEASLMTTFQRLIEQTAVGVDVQFATQGTPYDLPEDQKHDLYRIGQEALTNALRHSQAKQIYVELHYSPTEIRLLVRDNGQGFHPETPGEGLGLVGMKERAERSRMKLQVTSAPEQGTQVSATLLTADFSQPEKAPSLET